MSVWSNVKEEFRRSPVATTIAPLGLLLGSGAICIGYLQLDVARRSASGGASAAAASPQAAAALPDGSIALVVIGVFLALTPAFALIVRRLYRMSRFFAVPASVVIAVLSNFLNRLNAAILGYGGVSPGSEALDDLLFYGTVLVFLAVAGREPLLDLARPTAVAKGEGKVTNEDAVGAIMMVIVAVLIWGSLVAWGQRRMVAAFLLR